MIIAIDGPAASGKGTLGKRIAERYGYAHLDTGLLYRAVARAVLDAGGSLDDAEGAAAIATGLDVERLDETHLRGAAMGEAASRIAVLAPVRVALLQLQRDFAARKPGAVLDGRDIGTVICPDADRKLFVTASPQVRARRRHCEFLQRGLDASYEEVLADIRARDARDSNRRDAPLRPAADARLLDTSDLDIETTFRVAVAIIDGNG